MTRYEFLEKLQVALVNDLSGQEVREHVTFYDTYITEEVNKGRAEAEVIAELGDPWVIAQTIIDMSEGTGEQQGRDASYQKNGRSSGQSYQNSQTADSGHVRVFGVNSGWKLIILILGIIGVVTIVVAVIGGIFSLLAPVLFPLLMVMLIFRLINGRRR